MTNTRNNRTQAVLAYAPRLVTSTGLVTIAVDTATDGALLEIDNGVTMQGLKITDGGGVEVNSLASHRELSVYVRARSGNTGTIAHLDSGMNAAHKIRVADTAANLTVTADSWIQLVYSATEGRWLAYDLQRDLTAPVESVNGQTGAVVLTAADVEAEPEGTAAAAVSSHVAASNPHAQYTRSLRYSGTTSGSGTYSATFGAAFSSTPNVQANIVGGSSNQVAVVTSRSTTGFTVTAYTRNSINLLGNEVLLAATSTTNGLTVDVLIVSND